MAVLDVSIVTEQLLRLKKRLDHDKMKEKSFVYSFVVHVGNYLVARWVDFECR